MSSDEPGSITRCINELRGGIDEDAAQKIWNRYYSALARLAEKQLKGLRREATGSDIALSAMNSLMLGLRDGRYPRLADSDQLWPLLVAIAANKSKTHLRRHLREKRSADRERPLDVVQDFFGVDPTPEFVVELFDLLQELVDRYDQTLRHIVLRKLDGVTNAEIASELECVERTVQRKLALVRKHWAEVWD